MFFFGFIQFIKCAGKEVESQSESERNEHLVTGQSEVCGKTQKDVKEKAKPTVSLQEILKRSKLYDTSPIFPSHAGIDTDYSIRGALDCLNMFRGNIYDSYVYTEREITIKHLKKLICSLFDKNQSPKNELFAFFKHLDQNGLIKPSDKESTDHLLFNIFLLMKLERSNDAHFPPELNSDIQFSFYSCFNPFSNDEPDLKLKLPYAKYTFTDPFKVVSAPKNGYLPGFLSFISRKDTKESKKTDFIPGKGYPVEKHTKIEIFVPSKCCETSPKFTLRQVYFHSRRGILKLLSFLVFDEESQKYFSVVKTADHWVLSGANSMYIVTEQLENFAKLDVVLALYENER